jgi:hypothetical protein
MDRKYFLSYFCLKFSTPKLNQMIDQNMIPLYVKIIAIVFALANMGYGVVGYFKPSQIFENSVEGIDLKGMGAKYAGFEYASRNLAIGIGLLLAAIFSMPLAIFTTLGIRALVEIQSVLINISLKKFNEGFITALVFLAIEGFLMLKMVG